MLLIFLGLESIMKRKSISGAAIGAFLADTASWVRTQGGRVLPKYLNDSSRFAPLLHLLGKFSRW